ncbi:hypothetical protein RvY_03796 [Ramazzottius varieornatus]|uniref:Receptor ligand binding region domain-containing protein n=1 Tax=Ramazzottius varieornatus TaxID=947166 RepID=A0A1D1UZI1_RAMVA|nr:hypothetical protein RvY_03796 [Ramazzottius varieornatus]
MQLSFLEVDILVVSWYEISLQSFEPLSFENTVLTFLLNSTYDDERLENRRRFPTAVSFARTSGGSYGAIFVAIMEKFGWKHVAVLADVMATPHPYVGRNRAQCNFITSTLRSRKLAFSETVFDARSNRSIENGLVTAGKFSRVILLCCLVEPLKFVLVRDIPLRE